MKLCGEVRCVTRTKWLDFDWQNKCQMQIWIRLLDFERDSSPLREGAQKWCVTCSKTVGHYIFFFLCHCTAPGGQSRLCRPVQCRYVQDFKPRLNYNAPMYVRSNIHPFHRPDCIDKRNLFILLFCFNTEILQGFLWQWLEVMTRMVRDLGHLCSRQSEPRQRWRNQPKGIQNLIDDMAAEPIGVAFIWICF